MLLFYVAGANAAFPTPVSGRDFTVGMSITEGCLLPSFAKLTHIRSFKAASSLPNFRHSFITEAEGLQLPS
jgi:hypothetical protein